MRALAPKLAGTVTTLKPRLFTFEFEDSFAI